MPCLPNLVFRNCSCCDNVGGPSDRPSKEAGEAGVPPAGRTVGPTLLDVGGPSDRPSKEAGEAGVPPAGRTVGPTLKRYCCWGGFAQKVVVSDPLRSRQCRSRSSPSVRGTLNPSESGNVFSSSRRGRAAEGGRGSVMRTFCAKPPRL